MALAPEIYVRPATCAFDAVVLAGSAGGLHAVSTVLSALPAAFPAAVVVAMHRPQTSSADPVPALLARRCALPVAPVEDGRPLVPGHVGVLPPRTALAGSGTGGFGLRAADDRRSLDATMAAIADRYGSGALGVVLTGRLDDGADGARAIKRVGGRVIVQNPTDAQAAGMPSAAMATGNVDFVLNLDRIAASLIALTMAPGAAELLRIPRSAWAN